IEIATTHSFKNELVGDKYSRMEDVRSHAIVINNKQAIKFGNVKILKTCPGFLLKVYLLKMKKIVGGIYEMSIVFSSVGSKTHRFSMY
ncbi:hypothetical protein ACJX0J_022537, partial [Zea mays]